MFRDKGRNQKIALINSVKTLVLLNINFKLQFMMKKLFTLSIFIFYGYFNLYAQKQNDSVEDYWHFGKVVLLTGDSIIGNFRFDLDKEILQVELKNTLQTYSARKIKSFRLYDRTAKKERHYMAMPFKKKSNYKTPTFFEVILQDNPITILGRETKLTDTVRYISSSMNNLPLYSIPQKLRYYNGSIHNFYFLYPGGRIKAYDGKKKTLLSLLADRKKYIKIYLKENKVEVIKEQNFIDLIKYYNTLKTPKKK